MRIDERIKKKILEILKQQGKNLYNLSKMTGIDHSTLYEIFNHQRKLSLDKLEKIAQALNVAVSELIEDRPQEFTSLTPIPLVGHIKAGAPIITEERIEGYVYIPEDITKDSKIFALKVKGNSMESFQIFDGDILIVKMQPTAENGDKVVCFYNGECYLRQFKIIQDNIVLQAGNPNYDPVIIPLNNSGDFKIIGVILYNLRRQK